MNSAEAVMIDTPIFVGQHCETTATGTLLRQLGVEISEPLLFGLGEGLSFFFWNMKTFDFPFFGGRVKPDLLTRNIAKNLGLQLQVQQTVSREKAWKNVSEKLEAGIVVGLKLDCYHLEYFAQPIHFAGHYVAVVGYDDQHAYLVDTSPQGGNVKTSLNSLADARAEKGPMSSKNLSYTFLQTPPKFDLADAVTKAAIANAREYLNPPISNVSYRGIARSAKEVVKWFERSDNIAGDFATCAMLMEHAGTGGSLFRNLFRDFLKTSFEITANKTFAIVHEQFAEIANDWSAMSSLFTKIASTRDREHVQDAADLFLQLADAEREAMLHLANIQ